MRLIFIVIGLIILSGCKKKDLEDITDDVIFPSILRNPCFDVMAKPDNEELIFRDQESFEAFTDSIRIYPFNLNCDTVTPPTIDFDSYILVGKQTSGGGCSVNYERKVYSDESNRQVIYEIKVRYKGLCDMLITSMNWALIPRVPEAYSIDFRVDER
jgi:hypothetical protein